jgi:SAM-dependent methyltransferase
MLIDLGGGTLPHPRADIVIDLSKPKLSPAQDATVIPWLWGTARPQDIDSNSADEVYSSHFMEHIPKGQPLINVMNEAWRVLKPGGTYTMILPLVGYTDPASGEPKSNHIGWQPWADPTHVSYWWLPEAFMYFCEGPFKPHADYGMQTWGALGSYVDPATATHWINEQRSQPVPTTAHSFWSVRDGWEGIVRLKK